MKKLNSFHGFVDSWPCCYSSLVEIRRYKTEDFSLAESLMKDCCQDNSSLSHLEQETSVLALDENGKVIGVGLQWRNELHDRTIVIEICVSPQFRRRGLGTRLYKELLEEFPTQKSDHALDIKCESTDLDIQKFAESLGFKKYLDCYSGIFAIEDMKLVGEDLSFKTLSEFFESESDREIIKKFHCSCYDRDHEPFLPLNKSPEIRYDYYSSGESRFGAVLLSNGEVVGCSFAYTDFGKEIGKSDKDITCLHGYAIGEFTEEEALRVQSLYSFQMKLLKRENHRNVYIEFDSIESISNLMLDWIPYTSERLLRFQKKL